MVWGAKLRGTPVPERVTGASLILSLTQAAAQEGRSVYLLGGAAGVPEQARAALCHRYPTLIVAGAEAPPLGFDGTAAGIDAVCARVAAAAPDIVYVGLGFPKQERLIARLAPAVPSSWFVGCGAAISFAAGTLRRAPRWMQQAGLEWLFRLASEPRRLAHRYLIDDVPCAALLLLTCAAHRFGRDSNGRPGIGPSERYRSDPPSRADSAEGQAQVLRARQVSTPRAQVEATRFTATDADLQESASRYGL
jgi:N-acetylglucosaminyldiphosphoundecaprenol N-acetyl-beta-D-mannosaminyltransferase